MTNQKDKDTSVIPEGMYCYSVGGNDSVCPYWSCTYEYDEHDWMKVRPIRWGKCSYLNVSDKDEDGPPGLLADQVKVCGINDSLDDDEDDLLYSN